MEIILTSATHFKGSYYITGRVEDLNYYVLFFEVLMNKNGVCKVIKPSNGKIPKEVLDEIKKQKIRIILSEFPPLPEEFLNEIILLKAQEELNNAE